MTYNKIIEELIAENEKLQSNMNLHFAETFQLQTENQQLKNELFNAYLLQQHNERLIAELKEALSSYNNFVDVMFPD